MIDLRRIPTDALLEELATRCKPHEKYQPPAWALRILGAVAAEAGISEERLVMDTSRGIRQTLWRDVAMTLLREHTDATFQEIAAIWGMNHGTVICANRRTHHRTRKAGLYLDFTRAVFSRLSAQDGTAACRTAPQVKTADQEATAQ